MKSERKRRGRPRLVDGEHTIPLSVAIPESSYERLASEAFRSNMELSAYVRLRLHVAPRRNSISKNSLPSPSPAS